MSCELDVVRGRPCDFSRCAESTNPSLSCVPPRSRSKVDERSVVRGVGLDVHRDFCKVTIAENGRVRSARRIAARVPTLALFAASLAADDVVALEATTGAERCQDGDMRKRCTAAGMLVAEQQFRR